YAAYLATRPNLPHQQTSYYVPDLPRGQTLWARIRTRGPDGVWRNADVSFTAGTRAAAFTNPRNGATNVDTTQPFTWGGASAGVASYAVSIGTAQGGHDLFESGFLPAAQTSYAVPELPTGTTLWARLRTKGSDGVWRTSDISYTTQ